MLTMFDDDDSVFAAMRAGARGYLLKGADQYEMLQAIRTVAGGQAVFGAPLARRLLTYFDVPRPLQPPGLFAELTEREQEILHLMAQGLDNHEIAGRLFISAKTVSNHAANICGKLQATDRAQAILMAREVGL